MGPKKEVVTDSLELNCSLWAAKRNLRVFSWGMIPVLENPVGNWCLGFQHCWIHHPDTDLDEFNHMACGRYSLFSSSGRLECFLRFLAYVNNGIASKMAKTSKIFFIFTSLYQLILPLNKNIVNNFRNLNANPSSSLLNANAGNILTMDSLSREGRGKRF